MRALADTTGFLFDLDGTLLDSNAAHARAFVGALEAEHPALARAFDYERVRGLDTVAALARLGLADPAARARLAADKRARYRAALRAGAVALYPGARPLLAALHAADRRLVVVTSASRASAEAALQTTEIAGFFVALLAAEDAPAPKPAPAAFQLALRRLDLPAAACLTVEDAPACALASLQAGIDAVLVHAAAPRADAPGVPCFPTLAALHAALGLGGTPGT